MHYSILLQFKTHTTQKLSYLYICVLLNQLCLFQIFIFLVSFSVVYLQTTRSLRGAIG